MPRRLLLLLVALTVLLLATASSALVAAGAQNGVRVFIPDGQANAGLTILESACTHEGSIARSPETASGFCVAAEDAVGGGARFIVDSGGETRIFLNSSEGSVEVTQHAALRITQRGLTLDQVEGVLQDEQPFQYFHAGQWKTGYYDPNSGVFVGTANGNVTTVINGAKPQYIANLQAAQP